MVNEWLLLCTEWKRFFRSDHAGPTHWPGLCFLSFGFAQTSLAKCSLLGWKEREDQTLFYARCDANFCRVNEYCRESFPAASPPPSSSSAVPCGPRTLTLVWKDAAAESSSWLCVLWPFLGGRHGTGLQTSSSRSWFFSSLVDSEVCRIFCKLVCNKKKS